RYEGVDPGAFRPGDLCVGLRLGALLDRRGTASDDERVLLGLAVLRTLGDRQLHGAAQRSRQREEPRSEPEDGTDVDRLVAARLGPRPLVAPARERAEDRDEVTGSIGQLVVDARRD